MRRAGLKLSAIASAAAIALSSAFASLAQAASVQVMPGDTTGAPTFNRAYADFSDLSPSGTAVHYSTYTFTVSMSGDYLFNTSAAFDSFVFLYENSFNPADATSNGVMANDDLIFGNSFHASGFEAELTSGTTYIYVVTGFDSAAAGAYSTTIAGPTATVPVPEVCDSRRPRLRGRASQYPFPQAQHVSHHESTRKEPRKKP